MEEIIRIGAVIFVSGIFGLIFVIALFICIILILERVLKIKLFAIKDE